ncbi:MAG: undecaprenyl-phosphate galactose phosphotransferase WbaP [Candidatus Aminicenantales bacterium]
MKKFGNFFPVFLLIWSDVLTLAAAFLTAFFMRKYVLPFFIHFSLSPLPFSTQISPGFATLAFVTLLIFSLQKLYSQRRAFWDETRVLIRSLNTTFVLMILIVFVSRSYELFSRAVIITTWFFSLFLFPLSRFLLKTYILPFAKWKKKAVIIGPASMAGAIAAEIKKNPMLGLELAFLVGLDSDEAARRNKELILTAANSDPVNLGPPLAPYFSELGTVILCAVNLEQEILLQMVEAWEKITSDIRIVPEFGTLFAAGVKAENLGEILCLSLPRNLTKPWNLALKRVSELLITFILFLLFFPLILIIALVIKLDSPGSAFFIQKRLGYGARAFNLIKFRSMYIDADLRLEKFFDQHPEKKKEWKEFQKIRGEDPRVTRVGKFLRRYSLDELPQLINVLKGDMSLVGPRPYLPEEKENLGEKVKLITSCRPGVTGLWQVSGRNLLTFRERILLDEYYLRNWSLWLDLVILLQTARAILSGRGAF